MSLPHLARSYVGEDSKVLSTIVCNFWHHYFAGCFGAVKNVKTRRSYTGWNYYKYCRSSLFVLLDYKEKDIMLKLICKDVQIRFGKKEVLKGVDAAFYEGTLNSVIGINGAGKSVFLKQ